MPSRLDQMQQEFRQKLLLQKQEKKTVDAQEFQSKLRIPGSTQRGGQSISKPSGFNHVAPSDQSVGATSSSARLPIGATKTAVYGERSQHFGKNMKTNTNNGHQEKPTMNGLKKSTHQGGSHVVAQSSSHTVQENVRKNHLASTPQKSVKSVHEKLTESNKPVKKPFHDKPVKVPVKPMPEKDAAKPQISVTKRSSNTKQINSAPKTSSLMAKKCGAELVQEPLRSKLRDPNLEQCKFCCRSFAKDRIHKHEEICDKTSKKKRKVFDATKMRVKGTEAEQFVRKKYKKEDPKPKKSNWRTQHENFIASIRQAKAVQKHLASGGKLSDLPPPPPSENPDYVPCPHCGRKFNGAAAERHIPKCKNIVSNKKQVDKSLHSRQIMQH
ncbi:uncharacterized protein LOC106459942 isoform X2 [Limulus polyphemus]|uniref:Uncharacterized protein LOC106459942 isoform X2 n=1 Tax=Limulus polyphemus TaxID=6850 RepID=A0ABM1SF20_LIMPO|nr:uncharacterized protein LOC106459942 isoform X2 [Limulus polyphemus]